MRRLLRWGLASLLFVLLVGLAAPSQLFRAEAMGDPTPVDTAVIFGFGFERAGDGSMLPGDANQFLLDWTLREMPHLTTAFVQEGVWVAACEQKALVCAVGSTELLRIDRHDDSIDLHTLDIAACALERMRIFDKDEAVVVAHDMQLRRAAENMHRVRDAGLCPECRLVVADVPDAPYPAGSAQWRNRHESVYRWIDVAARARFSPLFVDDVPQTCPVPMARPD